MKKLGKLFIFLLILAIIVTVAPMVYKKVRMAVFEKAVDTVVKESNITYKTADGKEISFKDVVEKVDEEDQKKVDELLDKYVNMDTIGDVNAIVKDGNVTKQEVEQYINENVEEEDITYLINLYKKYSDSFE